MLQSDQLASTLVQMAGLVLSTETVRSAVELVTVLASATSPSTDGAAVTLLDEHGTQTMAATSELAERADALQYQLDEGPCLSASRTGGVVRVGDTAGDRRWPTWNEEATQLGIRSALSAPLLIEGRPIGAIKLYARHAARFDEHDEQVMVLFARQAAVLLSATQHLADARALSRRLADALTARDLISGATGILMARGVPDRDAAFGQLAAAAERSGQPLREVARELLCAVLTDPPAGPRSPVADVADDDRHELVEAARAQGELSVADLWLRYLALGGSGDLFEVDGYLAGVLPLSRLDQNALAVAVNERLEECLRAARVPLTSAWPAARPAADLGDIIADLLSPAGARATAPGPSPPDEALIADTPPSSGGPEAAR